MILKARFSILMPIILVFCMVGSFAVDNTVAAVGVALAFGVIGYFMEEAGIPIAPFVLGIVLDPLVEQNFLTSMMKSGGSFVAFFDRPIAAGLALVTIMIWLSPLLAFWRRRKLIDQA